MVKYNSTTIVRTGIILMVLVLFPLISWIYLKGGINFRKEALAELEIKDEIGKLNLTNSFGKDVWIGDESSKVWAFFDMDSDPNLMDFVQSFYDQFQAIGEVKLLMISSEPDLVWLESIPKGELIPLSDSSNLRKIELIFANGSESNALLMDRYGNIRNFYLLPGLEESKRIVTHTAVLIPPSNDRQIRQRYKAEL